MTLPLPVYSGTNLQEILDLIAQAFIDTGGRQIKVRFGTGTCTFTASGVSADTTVTHGLGSSPVAVYVTSGDGQYNLVYAVKTLAGTTFKVTGYETQNAATTGTFTFYWLAIG